MAEKVDFVQDVVLCASRMSKAMEQAFVGQVQMAEKFLPGDHMPQELVVEARGRLIEIFVDYAIGTNVALIGTYTSVEPVMEEQFIAMVRSKFEWLRKQRC